MKEKMGKFLALLLAVALSVGIGALPTTTAYSAESDNSTGTQTNQVGSVTSGLGAGSSDTLYLGEQLKPTFAGQTISGTITGVQFVIDAAGETITLDGTKNGTLLVGGQTADRYEAVMDITASSKSGTYTLSRMLLTFADGGSTTLILGSSTTNVDSTQARPADAVKSEISSIKLTSHTLDQNGQTIQKGGKMSMKYNINVENYTVTGVKAIINKAGTELSLPLTKNGTATISGTVCDQFTGEYTVTESDPAGKYEWTFVEVTFNTGKVHKLSLSYNPVSVTVEGAAEDTAYDSDTDNTENTKNVVVTPTVADDEVKAITEANDITVDEGDKATLVVKTTTTGNEKNEEGAAQIQAAAEQSGVTLTDDSYLDISVFVRVTDADGKKVAEDKTIANTGSSITLSVEVPASLRGEGRSYSLYRYHDGSAELIAGPTTDTTIKFSSNQFSLYAIGYEEKKEEPTPTPAPTPAPAPAPTPTPAVMPVVVTPVAVPEKKPVDVHTHDYDNAKWEVTVKATPVEDGLMSLVCPGCGMPLQTVVVSGYPEFIEESAQKVKNARQGAEIVLSTKKWISINADVLDALKARPDVTLVIDYAYQGQNWEVVIPAGTNTDALKNQEGYAGFLYLSGKFGRNAR